MCAVCIKYYIYGLICLEFTLMNVDNGCMSGVSMTLEFNAVYITTEK